MKVQIELSLWDFEDLFRATGYKNNFNREQLSLLYDEIEGLEDDYENGCSPYGDDIVAICCDYSGYNYDKLLSDYGHLISDKPFEDELAQKDGLIEYLENSTGVSYDAAKENFVLRVF